MSRAHLLLAIPVLLAGCAGSHGHDDDDTDAESDAPVGDDTGHTGLVDTFDPVGHTDPPDDTDPVCPSAVVATIPADGSAGVFFRPDLRVTFTADERATATFALSRGVQPVPLAAPSWSDDGRTVVLRPAEGLWSSRLHVLEVRFSCGVETIDFTTGAVGGPVGNPDLLLGTTYVADLRSGQVIEPASLGPVFTALLQGADLDLAFLPAAHDAGAKVIELVAGWVDRLLVQDPCVPTLDVPPADFSRNPYFEVAVPEGLAMPVMGHELFLDDITLSGAFRADGSAIEGLRVHGMLDMRDVAPLMGLGGAPALCSMVWALSGGQAACVPCPDTQPLCVEAVIGGVTAAPLAGAALARITPADVAADPSCP